VNAINFSRPGAPLFTSKALAEIIVKLIEDWIYQSQYCKIYFLLNSLAIMPGKPENKRTHYLLLTLILITLLVVVGVLLLYITNWAFIGPLFTILASIELGVIITLFFFLIRQF